ncbi:dihydrofolate reductase family protein [Palleronia sp. KMU-117]|uniref:dihydrofolate reductase family protein n=1 Tax=Palleronia sp. KMU-117 TaxID=3434108 RepID=UPI003D750477
MITGHVFIATSLDGFIARTDDSLDWLMKHDGGGADTGYQAFIDSVDGIVMGRTSFQTVLGFGGAWPYPVPVVVMSRSLASSDIPEALRDRVEVSAAAPADLMAGLDGRGWRRVYVDGGQVIRAFLEARLITDMVVTVAPVLIGAGKPLFGGLARDIDLDLVAVRSIPPGFVQVSYRVK